MGHLFVKLVVLVLICACIRERTDQLVKIEKTSPRRGGLVVRILRACAMISRSNPDEYWGWEVGALMRCALLLALLGC